MESSACGPIMNPRMGSKLSCVVTEGIVAYLTQIDQKVHEQLIIWLACTSLSFILQCMSIKCTNQSFLYTIFSELQVVEFLLQIQYLEDKNYPGDQVEKALIVNRYNVSHAVKYLEAMVQLLDLGFPEDLVSDALVKSDNDRDRALDQLIS